MKHHLSFYSWGEVMMKLIKEFQDVLKALYPFFFLFLAKILFCKIFQKQTFLKRKKTNAWSTQIIKMWRKAVNLLCHVFISKGDCGRRFNQNLTFFSFLGIFFCHLFHFRLLYLITVAFGFSLFTKFLGLETKWDSSTPKENILQRVWSCYMFNNCIQGRTQDCYFV